MAPHGSSPVVAWNVSLLVVVLLAGCGGGGDSGGGGEAGPAPLADAGQNETAPVGTAVTLDGSASESPSGAPVSYQWRLTSKPSGSTPLWPARRRFGHLHARCGGILCRYPGGPGEWRSEPAGHRQYHVFHRQYSPSCGRRTRSQCSSRSHHYPGRNGQPGSQ